MRARFLCAALFILGEASAALGTVRIETRAGKKVIYNDGVGENARAALRQSEAWLAARVSIPSLYDELIAQAAVSSSIDARLVKSVMLIESAFDPRAVSRKGARGLMQDRKSTSLNSSH